MATQPAAEHQCDGAKADRQRAKQRLRQRGATMRDCDGEQQRRHADEECELRGRAG
jgi:hypothetical protein